MLKAISWLISIIIPALLVFDIIDPIFLIIIGVIYVLELIVNLLGVIILGAFAYADDTEFKMTIKSRLLDEMKDDKHFYFRSSTFVILGIFTLYMLAPLTTAVSIILGCSLVLQLINIYLVKKVMNYNPEKETEEQSEEDMKNFYK